MSSVPLRQALSSLAVAGLLGLSATGCGGSDPDPSSTPAPTTSTAGKADAPAPGGGAVSATDLCGFLQKNLARWKSAGGEFAAMTQVATELSTFYEERGQIPPRDKLDELTKAQCPDTRTEVLKTIGFDSFLEL